MLSRKPTINGGAAASSKHSVAKTLKFVASSKDAVAKTLDFIASSTDTRVEPSLNVMEFASKHSVQAKKDASTQVTSSITRSKTAQLASMLGGEKDMHEYLDSIMSLVQSPDKTALKYNDTIEISKDVLMSHIDMCRAALATTHDVTIGHGALGGLDYISIILSCKVTRECKYMMYKWTAKLPTQTDIALNPTKYKFRLTEGHVLLLETLHLQHRSMESKPKPIKLIDEEFRDPLKMGYLISLVFNEFICLKYHVLVHVVCAKKQSTSIFFISLANKEKHIKMIMDFHTRNSAEKFINDTIEYMKKVNIIDDTDIDVEKSGIKCVKRDCAKAFCELRRHVEIVNCPEVSMSMKLYECTPNGDTLQESLAKIAPLNTLRESIAKIAQSVVPVGALKFFYGGGKIESELIFDDSSMIIETFVDLTPVSVDNAANCEALEATVHVVERFEGAVPYKKVYEDISKPKACEKAFENVTNEVIPRGITQVLKQRLGRRNMEMYVRDLTVNKHVLITVLQRDCCWEKIANEYAKRESLPSKYAVYIAFGEPSDIFDSRRHILITDKTQSIRSYTREYAKFGDLSVDAYLELVIMPFSSSLNVKWAKYYEELVENDACRRAANLCQLEFDHEHLDVYIDYMHEMLVLEPDKRTMSTTEVVNYFVGDIRNSPDILYAFRRQMKNVCTHRIHALMSLSRKDLMMVDRELRQREKKEKQAAKRAALQRKKEKMEQEMLKMATFREEMRVIDAAKELEREENVKAVYAAIEEKRLVAKEAEYMDRVKKNWTERKLQNVSRPHILRGVDAAIVKRHKDSDKCPTKKKCHCRDLFKSCEDLHDLNKSRRREVKRLEMSKKMAVLTTQRRMEAGSP